VTIVAVLLAGSFARRQARAADPLLPSSLLRGRPVAAGALGVLFVSAATSPVVFVGSVYLQEAHGYGPWLAGCALLPVVGGVMVVGRWCTRVLGRFGPLPSCLAGCGLTGSGLVLLTFLSPGSRYPTGVLPGLVLIGAGLPLLWMACEIAAVSTVGRSAAGAAAGVVQCAGQIGAALGLALAVTMYSGAGHATDGPADPSAPTTGVTRAFWCCAVLVLCVAVTAGAGMRRGRSRPGPADRPGVPSGGRRAVRAHDPRRPRGRDSKSPASQGSRESGRRPGRASWSPIAKATVRCAAGRRRRAANPAGGHRGDPGPPPPASLAGTPGAG
jgi:hypothetical protein